MVCPENKELSWLYVWRDSDYWKDIPFGFCFCCFWGVYFFFLQKTKKPQYKVRLVVTGSLSWGADYTGRSWSSSLYIFTDALLVSCMLWVNAVGLCCDVNIFPFTADHSKWHELPSDFVPARTLSRISFLTGSRQDDLPTARWLAADFFFCVVMTDCHLQ